MVLRPRTLENVLRVHFADAGAYDDAGTNQSLGALLSDESFDASIDKVVPGTYNEWRVRAASPVGIFVRGAGGECHHNVGAVTIDRNTISTSGQHPIRIVGALGVGGVRTADNVLRVVVSRNQLAGSRPNVAVQAAAMVPDSEARNNAVQLRLVENRTDAPPGQPMGQAFVVSDGAAGNRVEVDAGSQAYARSDDDLLG